MSIEITVPCVAAHLLVTPQQCDCASTIMRRRPVHDPQCPGLRMVLRFLPTDADTECETCGDRAEWCGYGDGLPDDDPTCSSGRRPLRAGDRIAIRALCADCNGNGSGWPENPITCAGQPCPVCNGVCEECEGAEPEVVGHATVARVLPVIGPNDEHDIFGAHARGYIRVMPSRSAWWHREEPEWTADELSDHTAAGLVFTPGQVALELTDVEGS